MPAAEAAPPEVRVATFNALLSPASHAALAGTLSAPTSLQPRRIAEIVQRVAPDVLFINELNYDGTSAALDALHDNFLAVSQNGQPAQNYPFRYLAASNTGEHSGLDFNNDAIVTATPGSERYGDDCYGYGEFPGRYAMAVLSKFPIRTEEVRTFRLFIWEDMPGALLPDIPGTPAPGDWYNAAERAVFRLSSKSHWDVPIEVDGHVVHLLGSHPTPPTFDGPFDENGKRNHDEIRLWADYIDPALSGYLYDDAGETGGLAEGERFVICGDQNADPFDGDSVDNAIRQLTENPLVDASIVPSSAGGGTDTASFQGGLRVDYVLPSAAGLRAVDGGVFWPATGQPGRSLIGASDHRLVWMDLEVEPLVAEAVQGLTAQADGGDLLVEWDAQAGVAYHIETSPGLADGSWGAVAEEVTVAGGVATVRLPRTESLRFFRVGVAFE